MKDGSGPDDTVNYVYLRDGFAGYAFTNVGPGLWLPEVQQYTQLRLLSSGNLQVREVDGTVRLFEGFSNTSTPNFNGRLRELRDRNGNRLTFHYEPVDPDGVGSSGDEKFVLAFVIDTMGREIRYQYFAATPQTSLTGRILSVVTANSAAHGRLARVVDFKGDMDFDGGADSEDFSGQTNNRTLVFDYDGEGNLVRCTGPAATGTPNGNDFPNGKTHRYRYITSADLPGLVAGFFGLTAAEQSRVTGRLLHKITHLWRPNEVGNNPQSDPSDNLASQRWTYDTVGNSRFLGFVTGHTVGGTNSSNLPAGGTIAYQYTDLNPLRSMPVGVNVDPSLLGNLASLQVDVTDRRGNQSQYIYSGEKRLLQYSEFTRGLRNSEPAGYTKSYQWNGDRRLTDKTEPKSNRLLNTYNEGTSDRFQQGNLIRRVVLPDGRGGDQGKIETVTVYEPIYNRPFLVIFPRGADIANNDFTPPIADVIGRTETDPYDNGRTIDRRYSREELFDYQESTEGADTFGDTSGSPLAGQTVDGDPVLAVEVLLLQELGLPETTAGVQELRQRLEDNLTELGLGDLNQDGDTSPRFNGNIVKRVDPSVVLLSGSNQSSIEGDQLQEVVTLFRYNQFGQLTSTVDAEGNVHLMAYFPEDDPDGDSTATPAPSDGRTLDGNTGGYLKETVGDDAHLAGANNGVGAAPTQIRNLYTYDDVGNRTSMTDGRGIRSDIFVNELDQVVQRTRAAAVPGVSAEEPLGLTAFGYLSRVSYDSNDNVILRQVEDRGDTSNTGGFVDSNFVYDILDNQIKIREEVDVNNVLVTRFRYDANENQVMANYPEGNADASVYDERDLLFQYIRGTSGFDRPGGDGTVPSTTTYNYDQNRNLIEIVDAEAHGGTPSTIAGVGDLTAYTYDGYDRQATVTDPLGNMTTYFYDPEGNVVRTIADGDPVNDLAGATQNRTLSVTEFIHDSLNRVVATHRLLFATPGVTTNRVPILTDTQAMDGLAPYLPDAGFDGAQVPGAIGISVIGRVTTISEYDRKSRMKFTIEDDLDTARMDYDGANRVIRTVDPLGNTVDTAYDDNSNVIERSERDLTEVPGVADEFFRTTYLYDSLDRLQTEVNNIGQTFDYRYDSRGNLVAVADAEGPVGSRTIGRRGLGSNAAVVLNDFGNVFRTRYDGMNRAIETEAVLTASGRGDGANIGATLEGILSSSPSPDPSQSGDGLISTYYAFDDNSQLLAQRDDNGNTTAYIYDNQGRRRIERLGLNESGTAFSLVGADSGVFNVPLRGGAITPLDSEPTGTNMVFAYDRDDNISPKIDEAGNVLSYTYDAGNRPKICSIVRASGFVGTTLLTWQYDGLSRQMQCTDNNEPALTTDDVSVTYAYDSLSRQIEQTQQVGESGSVRVVSRDFDIAAAGAVLARSSLTYPNGRRVINTYDKLDRLVARADDNGAGGTFAPIGIYQYIGAGRVATLTYQNDTRLTYIGQVSGQNADVGYDGLRRVVNKRWERFSSADNTPGDDALIVGFGHEESSGNPAYDRMNNRRIEEKLHDIGNSEAFQYDGVYRLVEFDRGTLNANKEEIETATTVGNTLQEQTWTVDGVGNWTQNQHRTDGILATENRSHSDFNEIGTVSGSPYGNGVSGTHIMDQNGNLTDDGVRVMSWDSLNRLRQVRRKSDNALVSTYTYDCLGRRFRKAVTNGGIHNNTTLNGTTEFLYDDWQVVEERDGLDNLTQQYVHGLYIDEPLVVDNRTAGTTVSELNDSVGQQRHFYHCNTLYHVYGLTDEAGGLIEGYQYDAYGRHTVIADGNDSDAVVNFNSNDVRTEGGNSTVNNPWLFQGQRFDPETGTGYWRLRFYSYDLGRFLNRNLWGYIQGRMNLYDFAKSAPTMLVEPFSETVRTVHLTNIAKDLENKLGREPTFGEVMGAWKKAGFPGSEKNPEAPVVAPAAPNPTRQWGSGHQSKGNCWRYACDYPMTKPTSPQNTFPTQKDPGGVLNCEQLILYMRKAHGVSRKEVGKDELCPCGQWKIFVVLSDSRGRGGNDMHFYREDKKGKWSHKIDTLAPSTKDAAGKPITDPEKADTDYSKVSPRMENYDQGCGFFCVEPGAW